MNKVDMAQMWSAFLRPYAKRFRAAFPGYLASYRANNPKAPLKFISTARLCYWQRVYVIMINHMPKKLVP